MEVLKIDSEHWISGFSENAHLAVFGEKKDRNLERIDFALLAVHDDIPISYVTCRELDKESIYWQYGGCVEKYRGSILSYRATEKLLFWCKQRYKRCAFYVENDNKAMLKTALKLGFKITGVRNFKNVVLLEHLLEW